MGLRWRRRRQGLRFGLFRLFNICLSPPMKGLREKFQKRIGSLWLYSSYGEEADQSGHRRQ